MSVPKLPGLPGCPTLFLKKQRFFKSHRLVCPVSAWMATCHMFGAFLKCFFLKGFFFFYMHPFPYYLLHISCYSLLRQMLGCALTTTTYVHICLLGKRIFNNWSLWLAFITDRQCFGGLCTEKDWKTSSPFRFSILSCMACDRRWCSSAENAKEDVELASPSHLSSVYLVQALLFYLIAFIWVKVVASNFVSSTCIII